MTLKFNRILELSKYMFAQNFIRLSAAVYELLFWRRKKQRNHW